MSVNELSCPSHHRASNWVILDLFKHTIKRNNEVRAVGNKAYSNQTYEGKLLVAQYIACAPF